MSKSLMVVMEMMENGNTINFMNCMVDIDIGDIKEGNTILVYFK